MSQEDQTDELALVPDFSFRSRRGEGDLLPISGVDEEIARQIISKTGIDLLLQHAMAVKGGESVRLTTQLHSMARRELIETYSEWIDEYLQMDPGAKKLYAARITHDFAEDMTDGVQKEVRGASRQISAKAVSEIRIDPKQQEERKTLRSWLLGD